MKTSRGWMPWIAAAGILAGASVAGAWRSAPSAPMAAPASIGVVRLGALLDGLTETKERSAGLETRRLAVVADLTRLEDEIKAIQAQIASDTLRGEDLFNAAQDMAEKQALGQARVQAAQTRLDIARGAMMREMYEKILQAAEQFAQSNGFDMIVVDDRSFPLADMQSSTNEHIEKIQARRVLFARQNLDVTDQLMVLMNNQWAARGANPQ